MKKTKARRKNSVRVLSFGDLTNALSDDSIQTDERYKRFVEGNRRLTTPLLALVYALIACTGLLVSNFNRRGQTKTIGVSLAAVILIQAVDLTTGNLAAKNLVWLGAMYLNILLPLLACVFLLLQPECLHRTVREKNPYAGGNADV